MIIQCKNCSRKFIVKDNDIPKEGRLVQCGHCSTSWHQIPISIQTKTVKSITAEDDSPSIDNIKASDGKKYRFLGSQWAEILTSGKTGRLARKKISVELNRITGREQFKKSKKDKKSDQSADQYQEVEGGMGIFSFLIVLVISVAAIILVLDTFKNQLIPLFPNLDNYLVYIFETLNNIYIIIKDLFNNYK